jgi:hypothetical protein
MDKERAEKVWARMLEILNTKTFSEKELAAGSAIKNFFGSVEIHKAAFDQAVKELTGT